MSRPRPTHTQDLGLLLGEAHSCPQEPLARLALSLAAVSTPLGGRAEPLHKLAILRGAMPGPRRKPRAYPLTLEWRFYPVPGHTPG